ncbi:prefoldin subunit 3 [Hirsutella rhossiliensis]|uniref:Prefoldin subunit 3 n=1 Tax=Hirsutella rhossiliensis TaxID=111463 RepID=A0A9P8SFS2_9HYPO|nr:prefoldin subunit 3 [Hirsutella rhossiliensis]KAH0959720.1 prefoldin subunit 3 [Hirsutella rhossiliensis]
MATYADASGKLYLIQCEVFNNALSMLQPRQGAHPMQRRCPNAYFWEAQRTLLAASAGLEKPLQVSRKAFRAIRGVLAGQAKNQTEMHSATRYAATWPPYLRPADGMDETADPEDSWSRAVNAGILMQEAGFAKEERDDALDVLQGMTTDGTPTIHQRITIVNQRHVGTWEASIRATRNAQEAWERFQDPPHPGWKPGPAQYSAMFEKLTLREADGNSHLLPGDKALSFPTLRDANLAEFERVRLRPPSVTQLYRQMRLNGIRPKGSCLQILVANAESLDTAHGYLRDSAEKETIVDSLTADDPKPEQLRAVPMNLFEAYIQVCSRVDGRRGDRPLRRGMHLASLRLDAASSRWAPVIWGPLLKALSQHRRAIKVSRSEQLRLFLRIMDRIDEISGMTLPTFIQFAKCIRKVIRRELPELLIDLETAEGAKKNHLGHFYTLSTADQGTDDALGKAPYSLLRAAAERIKDMFNGLVAQERHNQGLLEVHQVAPLDRMACRTDPVSSEHAYDYMVSLAFLGEFDEMARTLRWLMEEWEQPDVVDAIQELDEPPHHANFFETLCAFRLLAEPMLGDAVVKSLRQGLEASAAGWAWPDEEAVAMFVDMQQDDFIATLQRVLGRVRHWQTVEQTAEAPEPEAAFRVEDALVKGRLHHMRYCGLPRGGDGDGVAGPQDPSGNWC